MSEYWKWAIVTDGWSFKVVSAEWLKDHPEKLATAVPVSEELLADYGIRVPPA